MVRRRLFILLGYVTNACYCESQHADNRHNIEHIRAVKSLTPLGSSRRTHRYVAWRTAFETRTTGGMHAGGRPSSSAASGYLHFPSAAKVIGCTCKVQMKETHEFTMCLLAEDTGRSSLLT